ncbi:dynein light chain 1, cytoplasmic-like [Cervus elaphus]|uniref:dynein light chain 1, cytoplasmic-like n=1 Tax=Cervus elaphus TaxID=9860 RepID=UPI001CC2A217|nr:dynein light chain 1, cytoplasmic-like [Cervus elaphus]
MEATKIFINIEMDYEDCFSTTSVSLCNYHEAYIKLLRDAPQLWQQLPLYAGVSLASPSARRLLQSASPCSLVTVYDRKAIIKNADMSEEMQQDSVECATQAVEKYNIEKDIAARIKEFDKKYNPTWHCTVGRNFSSYVTHESKHFIYFYLDQVAILLFKSG